MSKFCHYLGDCTDLEGDAINEMIDRSRKITRPTLTRHIGSDLLGEWSKNRGYDHYFPLSKDWHVRYFKGTYKGIPCYFIQWSGIESVFIQPEDLEIYNQIQVEEISNY